MSFLSVLRGFFLVVILLIVLFSILATQTRLVFERITETATMRSIGYKNSLITQIFLCEALVLALIGSFLGILASVLVGETIDLIGIFYLIGILSEEVPFSIVVTPGNAIYSAFMLIVLAMVSCYIPLRKALALSISEAFAKK
jgi:putative ABC transport system permease protein